MTRATTAPLRALFVILALVAALRPLAVEQTTASPVGELADAFFDDSVVHDLSLNINSKDWAALKANYLLNDPYAVDVRWRDPRTGAETTVRGCAIRSRGTGSRSSIKPGLRGVPVRTGSSSAPVAAIVMSCAASATRRRRPRRS